MGTMKKIAVLAHSEEFGLGALAALMDQEKANYTVISAWEKHTAPVIGETDAWVILGGPMSSSDEKKLLWLSAEKDYLAEVVDSGKPILGLGLGARILAELLGSEISSLEKPEIGYFPLTFSPLAQEIGFPATTETPTFHWHSESFTLPEGAKLLASSQACPNQAFRYGPILAFQFHPEADAEWTTRVAKKHKSELKGGGDFIQSLDEITSHAPQTPALLKAVWTALWAPAPNPEALAES